MIRIGIVDTESSHVDEYIRYLNIDQLCDDAQVTALWGTDPDRTATVASAGQITTIADTPEDLLDHIDAVIIAGRNGNDHRKQAEPFLRAGIPTFVDKPLATNVGDAEAMITIADAAGGLLTSFSALRWSTDIRTIMDSTGGDTVAIHATGPAEAASPFGGISFYGIHAIELALAAIDGELADITCHRTHRGLIQLAARINDVAVTISLIEPTGQGRVPFHLTVSGRRSIESARIGLGSDYLLPGTQQFLDMIRHGRPPLSAPQLLRPVKLLECAQTFA